MELQRVIAVDFDGCLCTEAWPQVGTPNWDIINAAKQEKKKGAALVLWTLREGKYLEDALAACKAWGLEFDAVNDTIQSWKDAYGNNPRKVGATEYWDDRAVTKSRDMKYMSVETVAKLLNELMGGYPCHLWDLPSSCTSVHDGGCSDSDERLGCWLEFLRQYNQKEFSQH